MSSTVDEAGDGIEAETGAPAATGTGASDAVVETRMDRARMLAERVVGRVGGLPAVQTLVVVFASYDAAGGGLTAAGLAYAALFAIIPGLLLVLSVVGILLGDAAVLERLVDAIGEAVPPLEDIARAAFGQVSTGAVPTGIVAVVGLLWGSSRFYASLDYAFSRMFRTSRRRNELERGARGILVSAVFVALPIAFVVLGSAVTWVLDLAPDVLERDGLLRAVLQVGSPLIAALLFVAGTALIYRFVPTARVPLRAYGPPAIVAGIVIAGFTQLFTFLAPRMVGWAALFGALVAVFALLIWMSISLNVLLLGAAWTCVRLTGPEDAAPPGSTAGSASAAPRA